MRPETAATHRNLYGDWGRFREPARPSADVIAIYDRILSGAPRPVLLLGSTPEIRSICHGYRHDLCVVDRSKEIYQNVSSLVERSGPETFLCRDWLDMNFTRPFAIAIGDGSINMLEHHNHRPFFQEVWKQLAPGGELALHVHFESERRFEKPEEVFAWWRQNVGERLFENTWYHLTHFYNVGDGAKFTMDYGRFYEDLSRMYENGTITADEREVYGTALSDHAIQVYFCERNALESDIAGLFEIAGEDRPGDYPGAEVHPVVRFRRLEPA